MNVWLAALKIQNPKQQKNEFSQIQNFRNKSYYYTLTSIKNPIEKSKTKAALKLFLLLENLILSV
jgi:hypothetical protein